MISINACPVCKKKKIHKIITVVNGLDTSQCMICSHIFHSKTPSLKFLKRYYHSNFRYDSNNRKKNLKEFIYFLRRYISVKLSRPKFINRLIKRAYLNEVLSTMELFHDCKILDVGCGTGGVLQTIKNHGGDAYGIEASQGRYNLCSKLFGSLKIKNINVENLEFKTFNKKFDLIISSHVLEHCFDPIIFIKRIKYLLNDNGFIIISVPNFFTDFILNTSFYALHMHFFTQESLTYLFESNGLKVSKLIVGEELVIVAQILMNKDNLLNYKSQIASKKMDHNFAYNLFQIKSKKDLNKNINGYWVWNSQSDKLYNTFKTKFYKNLNLDNIKNMSSKNRIAFINLIKYADDTSSVKFISNKEKKSLIFFK